MNPLLGYGLISGIGSLASGLFNTFAGQGLSKDLMDYQYKLQQDAIDRQNLYNSPAEQVKRLTSAHLSPNLVYGSGVDGNQSSAASPSMVNRQGQLQNPLQDLGEAYKDSQLLELERIKTRNAAFESRERQLNLRARTLGQMLDNDFADATLDSRIKNEAQKLLVNMERKDNLSQQTNNLKITANNLIEQGNLLASKTHLTDEQARTEVVKQRSLEAGIRLTDAQAKQVAHMIPYIDAGTDLRTQEHEQKGLEFAATDELNKWLAEHPGVELTVDIAREVLGAIGGSKSGRHRSRKGRKK